MYKSFVDIQAASPGSGGRWNHLPLKGLQHEISDRVGDVAMWYVKKKEKDK